uniref:Uncharacterized protein n=1 Tax=Anopheles culicifacies TaxID=139723 RepID=A0A182MH43_9DIPT
MTAGVLELLFIAEAATTADERALAVVVVVGKDVTVVIVVGVFALVTVAMLLLLMTDKGTLPILPPVLKEIVLPLLTLDGTNGGGNADVAGDTVDDADVHITMDVVVVVPTEDADAVVPLSGAIVVNICWCCDVGTMDVDTMLEDFDEGATR